MHEEGQDGQQAKKASEKSEHYRVGLLGLEYMINNRGIVAPQCHSQEESVGVEELSGRLRAEEASDSLRIRAVE